MVCWPHGPLVSQPVWHVGSWFTVAVPSHDKPQEKNEVFNTETTYTLRSPANANHWLGTPNLRPRG
jgi:hypothetical protein